MISYLLASSHSVEAALGVIDNIHSLPNHEFEIISCSPYPIEDSRCISLRDDSVGSVQAFNKCYKRSCGDYVVICPDDHRLPSNFLGFIDFFKSEKISNLKLKIANLTYAMGGPGKLYWNKIDTSIQPANRVLWPISSVLDVGAKNVRPFNIFHFPVFEKVSIEKYLDGVIFNESFIHHYVDSWLGFYEEKVNGVRDCKDLGPIDIYLEVINNINNSNPNTKNDPHDHAIFKKLIAISDLDSTTYNTKAS